MWTYNNYSELYHHGILGQKWGKRNGPPYPLSDADHSSSERKAGWRKSLNKDSAARKAAKKDRKRALRNRKVMTNEELQERIQRLKLEKELKNLTKDDSAASRGRKALGGTLGNILKSTITKYAVTAGTGALLYLTVHPNKEQGFDTNGLREAMARGGINKDKKKDD